MGGTLDRESARYADLVRAGKFRTKERAELRKVCLALRLIEDLKENLLADQNHIKTGKDRKEIFEKIVNFD